MGYKTSLLFLFIQSPASSSTPFDWLDALDADVRRRRQHLARAHTLYSLIKVPKFLVHPPKTIIERRYLIGSPLAPPGDLFRGRHGLPYRGRGHLARLLKNVMERETSARRLPPARRSAEVYLQRRVAILEKQVKSLRLAAGALAEAAYLGDTLEPSDSEDEMEAESDLDNGDEEITSDGEDA